MLYSDNKQLTELHPEIVKNTSQTISQCPYKKKTLKSKSNECYIGLTQTHKK